MDMCAHCGKQIYLAQPSVYDKRAGEDIGRILHADCVPDAREARISELLRDEREACAVYAQELVNFADPPLTGEQVANAIRNGSNPHARTALQGKQT